jgi:microcompartment protein CcmL/EutN
MKIYPAIALIELSNIATGIQTGDAMVKKSPIALLKTGTISRGKYLVLVGGTVASVDEAYREGLAIAAQACLDSMILPDVHPRVVSAALGQEEKVYAESLGILETPTIAVNIAASDAAIKGAEVQILEMRLGDNYGGKGYTLFNGKVEDVQAAIEIACQLIQRRNSSASAGIIPRLHESMRRQINGPLRFELSEQIHLSDGEQDVTG